MFSTTLSNKATNWKTLSLFDSIVVWNYFKFVNFPVYFNNIYKLTSWNAKIFDQTLIYIYFLKIFSVLVNSFINPATSFYNIIFITIQE